MKWAVVALLSVGVLGAVVLLFLRSRQLPGDSPGGFRDWVKNPAYKNNFESRIAERDAIVIPEDISADEIQQMVDRLYVQKDEDFNMHRLGLVGAKATPQLVAALKNDRTFTMTFPRGGHVADPLSPFESICDVLTDIAPREAAEPLIRYASHEDEHFRKHAALVLGSIGSDECADAAATLLNDDEDYVRSFVMLGLKRSVPAGRCSPRFLDAVFPRLVDLLDRRSRSTGRNAPQLLLAIDRERAIPVMLSEKYFSASNREAHYILEAFNGIEYPIPHEKLLPLLKELEPLTEKYPYGRCYAQSLIAYALNPDEQTGKVLNQAMASPVETVREGAATALGMLAGVSDAYGYAMGLYEEQGWETLTAPQQHYCAVFLYDVEVCNGGHAQFFVNSSGDLWQSALEGLVAMEASEKSAILSAAVQLFGIDGPSTDNDTRHEQIAGFSTKADDSLSSLDTRYFESEESVEVLLANYARANRQHFTKAQE